MQRLACLLVLLLLSGCATAHGTSPERPALGPGIYDVDSGERLSKEALYGILEDARFVLVAETHDDPRDHAIQFDIYRALTEGSDAPVAIGMEMFQRPFQQTLDHYLAGRIDEAEMLAGTEWEERWGMDVSLYRPFWRHAAEHAHLIVALNTRRELTKRVSTVGVDGLTEWERADLPELDLDNEAYRDWLAEIFERHGLSSEDEAFERFYQAQVLWDETMAATAVEALEHTSAEKIVIIAGRGHVENRWGIPSRIERRWQAEHPETSSGVVTVVPVDSGTHLPEPGFADYVWVKRDE